MGHHGHHHGNNGNTNPGGPGTVTGPNGQPYDPGPANYTEPSGYLGGIPVGAIRTAAEGAGMNAALVQQGWHWGPAPNGDWLLISPDGTRFANNGQQWSYDELRAGPLVGNSENALRNARAAGNTDPYSVTASQDNLGTRYDVTRGGGSVPYQTQQAGDSPIRFDILGGKTLPGDVPNIGTNPGAVASPVGGFGATPSPYDPRVAAILGLTNGIGDPAGTRYDLPPMPPTTVGAPGKTIPVNTSPTGSGPAGSPLAYQPQQWVGNPSGMVGDVIQPSMGKDFPSAGGFTSPTRGDAPRFNPVSYLPAGQTAEDLLRSRGINVGAGGSMYQSSAGNAPNQPGTPAGGGKTLPGPTILPGVGEGQPPLLPYGDPNAPGPVPVDMGAPPVRFNPYPWTPRTGAILGVGIPGATAAPVSPAPLPYQPQMQHYAPQGAGIPTTNPVQGRVTSPYQAPGRGGVYQAPRPQPAAAQQPYQYQQQANRFLGNAPGRPGQSANRFGIGRSSGFMYSPSGSPGNGVRY